MPAEPHYPSLSNLRRIWNSRSPYVGSARRPSCRRCPEAALAGSALFLRSFGGRQYGMERSPSFLDGRGLPQVNRVIGLRFWLEGENHFVTTSAGICFDLLRECREKKPVQPKSARRFGTQRGSKSNQHPGELSCVP